MREHKYDTLKGILIFLVVLAHILITYDYVPDNKYNVVINGIYSFHMPLFFIISGYFSKHVNKKKIVDYFLIFLLMNASFFLFDYINYGNIDILTLKYSSWFILLLAIYRLIVCNKKIVSIISKKYSLVVIFVIAILSGLVFKELIIVRLFSFFYFFALGYRNKLNVNKKYCYSLLIIAISLLIMITLIGVPLDFLMFSPYSDLVEIILRIMLMIADTILFMAIISLIKNKEVPIITALGKNSIYIYVFHRIPVLILGHIFYPYNNFWLISLIISIVLCILINYLKTYLKKILQIKVMIPISVICLIIPFIFYNSNHELTINVQDEIDSSISIGFVGDLILLENQLKLSNNSFDYMFDNIRSYIQNTDYVFGVLEGPVDDNNAFSYGNFDDDKELRLNYPSSFLKGIESAGIDFVTISNNHMFDRGIDSYNSTIANLNNSNLDYTGVKDNYKIVDISGIKVGILAYTYGLNYLDNHDYLNYTNFLTEPYSSDFDKVKKNIHEDFMKLKNSNVDLIIVMPHYGTQFSNKVDVYQEVWNRFFISEGANIILGDHSHAIQPIQYRNNAIVVNSPGNYINSYIEHNGDISMYVKIFIDKKTHRINGSSITPIIATKDFSGKYYPVLLEDTSKENQKRTLDLIGKTLFNNKISDIKNTYYVLPSDSYKYDNKYRLELTDADKKSLIYKKIGEYNNICFIGDSITEGTVNGYKPWYLPLISYFDKNVINISKGSYTSYDILNNFSDKIKKSNCELSIINIGTNDIRYNKEDVNNYINNIKKMIELTSGEVIILSPWQTTERDYNINKNDVEKRKLYEIYNNELKKINNAYYIDSSSYIEEVFNHNDEKNYLIDGVHPNDKLGITLYSFAVLRGKVNNW